ncbi:DUF2961 domain-containing protein [Pontiellaceae bacterium B1224]|nr:DUF2961 domain-containing protein [Pontiellaceae bacterium B1224]
MRVIHQQLIVLCICAGALPAFGVQNRVLERMTQFESIPILECEVRTYEFSSFKRIAEAADNKSWLYERNGERTMFYDEGPGCVTRLWITGAKEQDSRISFYFDGETNASFSVTPYELFQSGMFPYPLVAGPTESAGGRICYIPFPYEKSLLITDCGASPISYYNITYEDYPVGTAVESWMGTNTYDAVADYLHQAGNDPKPKSGNQYFTGSDAVEPGEIRSLLNVHGAGVIQSLEFDFDPVPAEVLANCFISMNFDGMTTVDSIPLGEFFGSAVGEVEVLSLPIGMRTNGNWYCYFPMPYWDSAEILFSNSSGVVLSNFQFEVATNSQVYDAADSGYFHARRRSAAYSIEAGDLVLFDESGCAGRFAGLSLYMEGNGLGYYGMAYLEGDARIYIDGTKHPFIHGTGNEDWFNGAYYYNDYGDKGANQEAELFCMPYHGLPAKYHCQGADSWTQAYRFNIADPISWTSSMLFTIEHGQYPVYDSGYYSVVTYSYQKKDAASYIGAEIGVANAADHFYVCNGDPATNTAKYITPKAEIDAENMTVPGFSNIMQSAFSVSIPPENDGVILQSLSNFSATTNAAIVRVDGMVAGQWSHVDLNYTNSTFGWGINEVVLPSSLTQGRTRLDVEITYSSPSSEYGFRVLPIATEPTLNPAYGDWISTFAGLKSFTNMTDNLDGDSFNNLLEYALGGDPENAASTGYPIEFAVAGNTNRLHYIYPERSGEHGLTYHPERTDNLTAGSWVPLTGIVSTGRLSETFNVITNALPATSHGFIRLRVE